MCARERVPQPWAPLQCSVQPCRAETISNAGGGSVDAGALPRPHRYEVKRRILVRAAEVPYEQLELAPQYAVGLRDCEDTAGAVRGRGHRRRARERRVEVDVVEARGDVVVHNEARADDDVPGRVHDAADDAQVLLARG